MSKAQQIETLQEEVQSLKKDIWGEEPYSISIRMGNLNNKTANKNKALKLRLESLESFLGLGYAQPDDVNAEYALGKHFWDEASEWGFLQTLKKEYEASQNKKKK